MRLAFLAVYRRCGVGCGACRHQVSELPLHAGVRAATRAPLTRSAHDRDTSQPRRARDFAVLPPDPFRAAAGRAGRRSVRELLRGVFEPPFAKKLVLQFGRYGAGIETFRRHFASERLLILTDLELALDRQEVFRRACRFVGVDDEFMPATIALPRNQGVYFTPILAAIHRLNNLGFTFDPLLGTETLRSGAVARVARRLAVATSRASALLRHFVRDQEPEVSPQVRQDLLDYYRPDIGRLEALTGRDLSAWKNMSRKR